MSQRIFWKHTLKNLKKRNFSFKNKLMIYDNFHQIRDNRKHSCEIIFYLHNSRRHGAVQRITLR